MRVRNKSGWPVALFAEEHGRLDFPADYEGEVPDRVGSLLIESGNFEPLDGPKKPRGKYVRDE